MKQQLGLVFFFILISTFAGCSSDQFEFTIDDHGIRLKGAISDTFIPSDSLFIPSIQTIDLDTAPSHQPINRLWGVGQPEIQTEIISLDDYLEGWFLLRNGDIAFVFLSGHRQAVYFETVMRPPESVLFIEDLQYGDRPSALKNFSVLLGTDKPTELMELIYYQFANP